MRDAREPRPGRGETLKIRTQLVVLVVLVALGPVAVVSFTSLHVHRRALEAATHELHQALALRAARQADSTLDSIVSSMRLLVAQVRWAELSPEERTGALSLLYHASDDVVVASLFDERGTGVGAALYRMPLAGDDTAHAPADLELLDRFGRSVPLVAARASQERLALGPAIAGGAQSEGAPLVPLAFRVAAQRGALDEEWTVGVGVSLRTVCRDVRLAAGALEVLLVDGQGRLVCPVAGREALTAAPPLPAGDAPTDGSARVVTYDDGRGRPLLAATAKLARGGSVIVQQPEDVAFASGRALALRSLLLVLLGALAAGGVGLLLARGITRPVAALVKGTSALTRGDLGHRLDDHGSDELAMLARAFNGMAHMVEARDHEIRDWNVELQARVDERTLELQKAQDTLLRARNLAALGSLGAGFAHEINNPLTGVLGLTQLMRTRATQREGGQRDAEMLGLVEKEALRIRDIVARLLSLTREAVGEDAVVVDLPRLLDEVLAPYQSRHSASNVALVRAPDGELPRLMGAPLELREAFEQVLRNAVAAMPDGGTLTVTTAVVGGVGEGQAVRVAFADSGVGIEADQLSRLFDPFFTTRSSGKRLGGTGLGLTLVHRIVERHHGQVTLTSDGPGKGARLTITLPAGSRGAHLS